MRWLIGHPGPQFSVADVYEGWTEALRGLGEDVFTFNLDARLQFFDAALMEAGTFDEEGRPAVRKAMSREEAVFAGAHEILRPLFLCWPDVVLLISAFFMPPYLLDAMRARRMKVVLLHTESPYQDDEQLTRAGHADLNLVNDPANLAAYRQLGPAEYFPHCYRPSVHYPRKPRARYRQDFAFVGTGFPSRITFFEAMDLAGLDALFGGVWLNLPAESPLRDWTLTEHEDCVDNTRTAEIYRRSRTSINLYRREGEDAHTGQGWAMGPREVELAACGTWFCRDPRPEGDETFPMLPRFTAPEEAAAQIRWAAGHDKARDKAAAQARQAIADRTFDTSARRLLKLLGE